MIILQNLSMHYGAKELFNNVNLLLQSKNKYGLIGANGAGKSTFVNLLLGEEEPFKGSVEIGKNLKIGSLRQDQFKYENDRIIDVVLQGNQSLWSAKQEQASIIKQADISEDDGYRIAELETIIAENDGYEAEVNAQIILQGLGIGAQKVNENLSTLSGGYKIRVLLAQCLFGNPDILLLDEPTNHLDILSIQWLENFLIKKFKNIVILISHDHEFLNSVCDNVLDIDYKTITLYPCNYNKFVQDKQATADLIKHQKLSIEKKIQKDQEFINKFRASAARSTQAKSREKRLEKIEVPEIKKTSRIAPKFLFQQQHKSGREVLEVIELSQAFNATKLFQNLSCKIHRGEKIAILGQNGVGKSTLLKTILNIAPSSSGQIKWGFNVATSYFSQDHHELIKGEDSVMNWLMDASGVSEIEKN